LHEVISDVLDEFEGPVLFGFPSGHGTRNITIPFGVPVKIHEGMVSFLEEA
jgi:muramoyltetrapeptide carboxypeptidase LdcA involved in peptidoglycan recycling